MVSYPTVVATITLCIHTRPYGPGERKCTAGRFIQQKKETTLLRLSQLQLMSLLHWVSISPIPVRVHACVKCVGCLQSNELHKHMAYMCQVNSLYWVVVTSVSHSSRPVARGGSAGSSDPPSTRIKSNAIKSRRYLHNHRLRMLARKTGDGLATEAKTT